MKFILLMYAPEGAWPPDEHLAAIEESVQLCNRLQEQGKYLAAAPLQPPTTAKSVRIRDGVRLVSDGPFLKPRSNSAVSS